MLKNTPFKLFIVIVFANAFSCEKHSPTNNDNYKSYSIHDVEWSSKSITNTVDLFSYTATEVPLQFYIQKNGVIDAKSIDSIYNSNSRERIIEMEFRHADKRDLLLADYTRKSYEDSVKYMSFLIQNDFNVVTSSNDTIICSGVNFERNFNVAPFKRVLLYFNNLDPEDNISLIYTDSLFGNGTIQFNFNEIPLKL